MILPAYGSSLRGLGAVEEKDDDGSAWKGAEGILNSGAVGQVLGWLTGQKAGGSSSSSGGVRPATSATSPWVYIGGGLAGVTILTLLLRKRR